MTPKPGKHWQAHEPQGHISRYARSPAVSIVCVVPADGRLGAIACIMLDAT
jgi:hypothetical protein